MVQAVWVGQGALSAKKSCNYCAMDVLSNNGGMPPYNTAVIDLNGADANFFKIRVDNLADEVR